MAGAVVFVNDLFDEDITIDNVTFPWVHSISIKAKLNSARQVTIQFSTREGLAMCNIGSTLKMQIGKSDVANGINFVGKIKSVVPSFGVSTATAFDYIADLNSSELFYVKDKDYASMDLIQAAKMGLSNSKDDSIYHVDATTEINLKHFNTQCGVRYQNNQGFEGYQTRKAFLDKIFDEAYTAQPSSIYLGGAYPPLTFLKWYYAIRNNNVLEVFQPDIYTQAPVATLGRNNFNVVGNGLNATIDTARMINSVVVENDNIDYSIAVSDTSSINQYGSQSLLLSTELTNTSRIDELAHSIVSSNNEPAGAYTLLVENGHWIDIGNLVEITIPTLEKNRRMVVNEYTTTITDTITTTLTLGSGKITTADLIKRISTE